MTASTLKQLFQYCATENQFTIPFEVQTVEDVLSGNPEKILLIGKKLPDRVELDRTITSRYYKRQLRTIAQDIKIENDSIPKLIDNTAELIQESEDPEFGRLIQDDIQGEDFKIKFGFELS